MTTRSIDHFEHWTAFGFVALALFGSACGGVPNEGEPTAEAEQAFTTVEYYTWAQKTLGAPTLNMSSVYTHSCFLAGVAGNLDDPWGVAARVGVFGNNLVAQNGGGESKVRGVALCVPPYVVGANDWDGGAAKVIAPVTSTRLCFLKNVSALPNQFASLNDFVRVWHDSSNWYIGGNGHAAGSAACIDVSEEHGSYEYGVGSGQTTIDLDYDDGGVQCLLTGVGGKFRYNSWNDGAVINYNAGLRQWTLTLTNSKRAWVTCFK